MKIKSKWRQVFSNKVTGDEMWAYLYEPKMKKINPWNSSTPLIQDIKSSKASNCQRKLVTIFWHHSLDFLKQDHILNTTNTLNTWKLKEAIRRKRTNKILRNSNLPWQCMTTHKFGNNSDDLEIGLGRGTSTTIEPGWHLLILSVQSNEFRWSKGLWGHHFDNTDDVKVAKKKWV